VTTKKSLHQARLEGWSANEFKVHLAEIVDALAENGECSPISVLMELLSGEFPSFLLIAQAGHLDPPRPDGKVAWAVLRQRSEDRAINESLCDAVRGWLAKN
jgi:hypothetical protein